MRNKISSVLHVIQVTIAVVTLIACFEYLLGDLPNPLLDILPAGPGYLAYFVVPAYWLLGLAAYVAGGSFLLMVLAIIREDLTKIRSPIRADLHR